MKATRAVPAESWTAPQSRVIDAPADAHILVTAGAGTGKTAVLIARLARLVESGAVQPGSELLVLTFSRAAVGEIRDRLRLAEGAVSYVRAQTFDSFATHLLAQFAEEESWKGGTYDQRIRQATALLGDERVRSSMESLKHLLVDELQDLVGDRIPLVRALIQSKDCGFTLFQDPAQSIFEFQSDGLGANARKELFDWLRVNRRPLLEIEFADNFRAKTARAKCALEYGPQLSRSDPDYASIAFHLKTVLLELPSATLDEAVVLLRKIPKATAILCRNNGQALVISRELDRLAVPHELRRPATDRAVHAWIGAMLGGYPFEQIGRRSFDELAVGMRGERYEPPPTAWELLKRIDGRLGDNLDLSRVAQRLIVGDVPDELTAPRRSDLVVSTVHRAKGLQFERVLVCGFDDQDPEREGFAEELRLLYVALTRTTSEQLHLTAPDTRLMSSKGNPEDRWVRKATWNGRAVGLEVEGNDTHSEDPVGAFLFEDGSIDVVGTQSYLRSGVSAGAPVELALLRSSLDGAPRAFYRVDRDGRPVALTSERFGRIVGKVVGGARQGFPAAIGDLTVEGVDTVAGSRATAVRAGLGPSGLWLRVRIAGLGTLGASRPAGVAGGRV